VAGVVRDDARGKVRLALERLRRRRQLGRCGAGRVDSLCDGIDDLLAAGDIAGAQKVFADRKATGEASSVMNTLTREMAVVGQPVPAPWAIEKWFQGSADLDGGGTKLLVFWEEWCPYCKKELPHFQEIYEKYKGRGLQVVGLTRLTRTATEAGVLGVIAEKKVGFPIAKESGAVAEYFHVKGIPAAAVVRDGKIIWRGHPLRLTDEMLQGWL
jgi:thiol-disulfide isomerase/thioredoxin